MADLKRKTIVLDGIRVSFLEKESIGPAVLLLHGFASGSYIWKNFPERIVGDFRILIPDLPGHGTSSLPEREPTLEYHVQLIEQFRLASGAGRFIGIGHSMGAAVFASYSITFPGNLNGLILESPPDVIREMPFLWKIIASPGIGEFLMNFYPPSRNLLRKRLNSSVTDPSVFDEEMVDEAWNAFSFGTMKKWVPLALRVKGVPVPWEKVPLHCKVAYGKQDRLVNPLFLNRLKEALPSSEFHGFENCRHVPHLEYPEKFAALLVGF